MHRIEKYIDGCMIKAILEMYVITKEQEYFIFADHYVDYRVHEDGTIEGYRVEEKNIDNINAGKTLLDTLDKCDPTLTFREIVLYSRLRVLKKVNCGLLRKNGYR